MTHVTAKVSHADVWPLHHCIAVESNGGVRDAQRAGMHALASVQGSCVCIEARSVAGNQLLLLLLCELTMSEVALRCCSWELPNRVKLLADEAEQSSCPNSHIRQYMITNCPAALNAVCCCHDALFSINIPQ